MKKQLLSASIACCFTLSIAGCSMDQMSKADIGTGIGAIAGAVIGNQVGDKAAVLIGAAAGAYVGRMIGADLDEQDRKALAEKSAANMETMQAGQVMTWKSERTGNEATMKVARVGQEQKSVTIPSASQVAIPTNLVLLNTTYQTLSDSTIYTETNTSAATVGNLPKGTIANVVGKSADGQWLMVSRKGNAIGFIQSKLAVAYTPAVKQNVMAVYKAPSRKKESAAPIAVNLDTLPAKEISQSVRKPAFDLDAVEVKPQTAMVTTECKTLTYDIKAKGTTNQETAKACKTASGAWELG